MTVYLFVELRQERKLKVFLLVCASDHILFYPTLSHPMIQKLDHTNQIVKYQKEGQRRLLKDAVVESLKRCIAS